MLVGLFDPTVLSWYADCVVNSCGWSEPEHLPLHLVVGAISYCTTTRGQTTWNCTHRQQATSQYIGGGGQTGGGIHVYFTIAGQGSTCTCIYNVSVLEQRRLDVVRFHTTIYFSGCKLIFTLITPPPPPPPPPFHFTCKSVLFRVQGLLIPFHNRSPSEAQFRRRHSRNSLYCLLGTNRP